MGPGFVYTLPSDTVWTNADFDLTLKTSLSAVEIEAKMNPVNIGIHSLAHTNNAIQQHMGNAPKMPTYFFFRLIPFIAVVSTSLWLAYLVFIGGDIFPAFRHFVIVIPLIALLLAIYFPFIFKRFSNNRKTISGILIICIFSIIQLNLHHINRAKTERWEFTGKIIAERFRSTFGKQKPTIAVSAAGCIPYWSKLPCIDMLGLNDAHIAKHPPANFGNGRLAHELGDANYILRRSPDIIIGNVGRTFNYVGFLTGKQLDTMPEFRERYAHVTVWAKTMDFNFFVLKESPKTGIIHNGDSMSIPAYLFSSTNSQRQNEFDQNGIFTKILPCDSIFYSFQPKQAQIGNYDLKLLNGNSNLLNINYHQNTHLLTIYNTSSDTVKITRFNLFN